ncbi:MAG: VWA domain-containing protein [Deltaproteobacteria bacterium]|nr:VWA domain-containing protein [Deltaproteobacteria bacterium]
MENTILKFVSSARSAGLRISTSETLDCLKQLSMVDLLNETQFSRVLRANFAKSRKDQAKFEHLYHLFFHELRDDEVLVGADSISGHKKEILETLDSGTPADSPLPALIEFMDGNPAPYLELLRRLETEGQESARGPGSNLGSMVRRINVMLTIGRARNTLAAAIQNSRDHIAWETREGLTRHFEQRLDSALRLLTRHRPTAPSKKRKPPSHDRRLLKMGEIPFTSLTPKEVQEMRDVIRALVRKLKDTVNRRYAVRSRGSLDVKKTLRKAMKYQGVPMEIVYRKKPPKRGKIVVLCDVSGSVWSSARFMLNMLYSLQECFIKVRSFIFVAGLDEVTRFFEDHDVHQAIDRVMNDADIEYDTSTDYGLTFREFKAGHMDALYKKTTLIIIGDGRSNYANPEAAILDDMREKCRRLIWLNPETQMFWYSGDSEMRTYEGLCNEVRPCANLNQLTEFIRELVL